MSFVRITCSVLILSSSPGLHVWAADMVPDMQNQPPHARSERGLSDRQSVAPLAIGADVTVPAIAFAVGDIQQVLTTRGDKGEVVEFSQLSEGTGQDQIVIGLADDEALLTRLQAAGGNGPGQLSLEGYTLRT